MCAVEEATLCADDAAEEEDIATTLALTAAYYAWSAWVTELIEGNPTRIFSNYRMSKPVFKRFCRVLKQASPLPSSWARVSIEESAAIFLYCVAKGASNADLRERFQHSGETIHRHFYKVLDVVCNMSATYFALPNSPSPILADDPKYAGQFDNCRLAFDGTHVPAYVAEENAKPFRDRTGKLSQKVFAACTFDMQFVYVLSGWEGSAADSTVLADARRKGFRTPRGIFDLGDAGYGLSTEVMTPYRGVRYHLREWGQSNERPQNPKELYNLRHAQARNVIERAFGVLKKRFPILRHAPEYTVAVQAKIVRACCVLHNFIRLQNDLPDDPDGELNDSGSDDEREYVADIGLADSIGSGDYHEASRLRDQIAQNMWNSYQTVRALRSIA